MAATAKEKKTPKTELKNPTAPLGQQFRHWLSKNYIYVLAFCIPAALTYFAYALFGLYPFGPESVLALDLNGQYVYYFEALRDAFWGDGSIFYSWSRNLSGEFMGIIGYYLASPFTMIVILLPRKMLLGSLLIMELAKLATAGLTFNYFLQKSKNIRPLHSLLFSVMYAMMAYAVIQLIDPMWLDGIVFLPLICLGVEYLVDDGRKLNFIIPLAIMCIANFYIGYMVCLFMGLYFLYYFICGSENIKRDITNCFNICVRFAVSVLVALMCAAIMLLPVYNALKLGKFEFTANPDYSFAFQFEPLDFLAQLFVAQYDSVNVQGMPEIYCGVLTVLLLPLFYTNSKISLRKKIGLSFLLLALFASMYINPIDMLWHGLQEPNWLPFRYSFLFSFVLLTMAALSFEHIKEIKPSAIYTSFFGIFMFLMFVLYEKKDGTNFEHLDKVGCVWISIGLLLAYGLLMYLFSKSKHDLKRVVPILMLLVISCEMVYNAYQAMLDIDDEVAYSERKSYNKYIASGREVVATLKERDSSLYRCDKTFHRTVNDSLAFGLRGITHSSSIMNTRVIKLIEALGYSCRSYYTRYNGNTPLTDSLLGIKYVLAWDDKISETYEPIFSQEMYTQAEQIKTVTVYENPDALSIGYMVDQQIQRIAKLGNDNPFNSQNVLLSSLMGETTFDTSGNISGSTEYWNKIELTEELVLNNVTPRPYGAQTCYDVTAGTEGQDHTIDIKFTAETDEPIYFFFKTENEKSVNLWLSEQWNEDGEFVDGKWVSNYFETDNYCIMRLGSFEAGQQLTLRITVANDYTIIQNLFFYHFNYDLFHESIQTLQQQQWDISDDYTDTCIEGTITAKANQVMMTSIPYEEGWTIWVDGEKVEPVILVNSLIGVSLSEGTHTVKMRFIPAGFLLGAFLLVLGIFCIVVFYLYDKKHNKMLIRLMKEKQAAREAFALTCQKK